MQNLEIGDIVIPMSNPFNKYSQQREKGVPCEVTAIKYCSKEGFTLINLNNNKAPKGSGGFVGCPCGEMHLSDDLAWTVSSEFVKGENLREAELIAVEEEDWDLAIKLRDLQL